MQIRKYARLQCQKEVGQILRNFVDNIALIKVLQGISRGTTPHQTDKNQK